VRHLSALTPIRPYVSFDQTNGAGDPILGLEEERLTIRPIPLFLAPGERPNGLAADAEGLWICDLGDNRIYKVRSTDGSVITSFASPARKMSGIAVGGGAVWASHNQRPASVFKFDPGTGQCLEWVILTRPDEGGVHGLEWDNGSLWTSRPGVKALHRIDPSTGEVLQEIAFPGSRAHGLFLDGQHIACNDTSLSTIFLFDKSSGRPVDEVRVEGIELHGMTLSADRRLWITDDKPRNIAVAQWPLQ
jgi:sugar lactone lactonase YvrE